MDNEIFRRVALQRSRWIAAINASNADGFVAVLAEDAVWLPAMSDAIVGRDDIRVWLEKPFARFNYDYSVSDVRVRLAGDRAVERARFSTEAEDRITGSAMPLHEGEYLMTWKKMDGGDWLIERYIDLSADFQSVQ